MYRRFTNKTLIMELVDYIKKSPSLNQNTIISKLMEIKDSFDYEFTPFTLPNNL